jgi:hypothetical protein
VELVRNACAIDAPKNGMRVEAYTPPREVIDAIERIVQAAGIDVGGIEYMVDDRDGQLYYYDVNALSNFVADAVNVIGFNPHARLVDFSKRRPNSNSRRYNHALWLLASRVRRMAPQRGRRRDGHVLGIRKNAGPAQ